MGENSVLRYYYRIYVFENIKIELLYVFYNNISVGYLNIRKIFYRINNYYYQPNININIENYIH